jgi:hypothetical protein
MIIEQSVPILCWRPYPEAENPEQIAAAFDVFWEEYITLTEWTAAHGLPQPSLDDFLQIIGYAWNRLAAWQPEGVPQ